MNSKFTPCLASELKPGDSFRRNSYAFAPTYNYDYDTKAGISAHGIDGVGRMRYITISHNDIVYKLNKEV